MLAITAKLGYRGLLRLPTPSGPHPACRPAARGSADRPPRQPAACCRYTLPSGRSGFATPQHADAFRRAAYAAANVSLGGPAWEAGVPPPVITYLMAMNHEPVVNNGEVGGWGAGAGLWRVVCV
jgi:hypothetical protein